MRMDNDELQRLKKYYGFIIINNPTPAILWRLKDDYYKKKIKASLEFLKENGIEFTTKRIWTEVLSKDYAKKRRMFVIEITSDIYKNFWCNSKEFKCYYDRVEDVAYCSIEAINKVSCEYQELFSKASRLVNY